MSLVHASLIIIIIIHTLYSFDEMMIEANRKDTKASSNAAKIIDRETLDPKVSQKEQKYP